MLDIFLSSNSTSHWWLSTAVGCCSSDHELGATEIMRIFPDVGLSTVGDPLLTLAAALVLFKLIYQGLTSRPEASKKKINKWSGKQISPHEWCRPECIFWSFVKRLSGWSLYSVFVKPIHSYKYVTLLPPTSGSASPLPLVGVWALHCDSTLPVVTYWCPSSSQSD